jgi:formylmethanofuran dehydrogenase subunit E
MTTLLTKKSKFPKLSNISKDGINLTKNSKFPRIKKEIEARQCDSCKMYFDVNDLDLVDGDWLCASCEDNLYGW